MKKKRWFLLDLASPLHNRPINEITSAELLYLLKSIEKSGRRETAKKMRGAISAVFRLAIVTLRAENDPTLPLRDALIPPMVVGRAAITDEYVNRRVKRGQKRNLGPEIPLSWFAKASHCRAVGETTTHVIWSAGTELVMRCVPTFRSALWPSAVI